MSEDKVIRDFGDEWERFDFLDEERLRTLEKQFGKYIAPLPEFLKRQDSLFIADFGAGTGRWSHFLRKYASKLYVLEPSSKAFKVVSARFEDQEKVVLLNESVESNQIPKSHLDLAVSLGVLHHIKDTGEAIRKVSEKVKPGGYFLGYLYYAVENKSKLYRAIWKLSDLIRRSISNFPRPLKIVVTDLIALIIYWPLARLSRLVSRLNLPSSAIPLHHYENLSFHVMRNDALDRFGTSLENRFTKAQITEMLKNAGFEESSIRYSEEEPFWTFVARKAT